MPILIIAYSGQQYKEPCGLLTTTDMLYEEQRMTFIVAKSTNLQQNLYLTTDTPKHILGRFSGTEENKDRGER